MKSKLQKIILCLFLLCCIYNLWTLRPLPEGSWHTWYVIDIGNGFTDYKKYIEGPYEDLYCFPTIKSNDNCIVKNYLMVINEYPYRNTHIGINDFTEYQLTQENKIERVFNPHDFK